MAVIRAEDQNFLPPIDSKALVRQAATAVGDKTVARALYAYESLATGTGREDRMRVAIHAVMEMDARP